MLTNSAPCLTLAGASALPTDGAFHGYAIFYRGDTLIAVVDDPSVPVAVLTYKNPAIQTLPTFQFAINDATGPGVAPTIVTTLSVMADYGKNGHWINDAVYPNRRHTVDILGSAQVASYEKIMASYSASASVALAASATDVATIAGNANTTVYVFGCIISGTQTTAGEVQTALIRRSTVDTGGTAVAMTAVPNDSNDAAAQAVVNTYTANPAALGTVVGTVRRPLIPLQGVTGVASDEIFVDLTTYGKPQTLRGAAQQLALNLNGVTVTGGNLNVTWLWGEK